MTARLLIEARNEADTVIRATERALGQGGHLIDDDEADRIRRAVDALKGVRRGNDRDAIRAHTDQLNQATLHLAEVLMDSALRETLTSKRVTEALGER